jgi:hypothetical protein
MFRANNSSSPQRDTYIVLFLINYVEQIADISRYLKPNLITTMLTL